MSSNNPWLNIGYTDYEKHMSHPSVSQLQTINRIILSQCKDHKAKKVLILGITTGNGLEHIDNKTTIHGVDINSDYLNICMERYGQTHPKLKLHKIDLNQEYFVKDRVELIIANLFLEYIPVTRFFNQIERVDSGSTVISVVFQKSNRSSFVSDTGVRSLETLSESHREIDSKLLEKAIKERGYKTLKKVKYSLPNRKELIRIDFSKGV